AGFFPDLASADYETALAIFHQRYSTNTTSSWPLAQPFRMLAHNGEINTLWGNRNAMRAREPALAGPPWGDAVDRLKPVIWSEGSDSASLDNALELLVRSGRDPVHALMMLVPEAHEGAVEMEPALRGFYEFHECLVEPWDGPAALAFSDGVCVGSALDRNGLRPCRYKITRDGLVVAGSESGLVDLNAAEVVESGRLGPGELLVVDTRRKAILRNAEAKREVARRRPYSRWAARGIRLLRPTAAVPDAPPAPEPERVARQLAFGWSFEDLRYVLEPMGGSGPVAVGGPGGGGGGGGGGGRARRAARRARRVVSVGRARGAGRGADRDSQRPGRRPRARPAPDALGRRGRAPAPARARPADSPRPHRRSGRRVGRAPLRRADRLWGGSGAPLAGARVRASARRGGGRARSVPRRGRGRPAQDP